MLDTHQVFLHNTLFKCETFDRTKLFIEKSIELSSIVRNNNAKLDFSYNKKILDSRVRRTNIMYGGQLPDLRNVIFTNGDIDPWHSLSVLKDLNAFSPAIVIKGKVIKQCIAKYIRILHFSNKR